MRGREQENRRNIKVEDRKLPKGSEGMYEVIYLTRDDEEKKTLGGRGCGRVGVGLGVGVAVSVRCTVGGCCQDLSFVDHSLSFYPRVSVSVCIGGELVRLTCILLKSRILNHVLQAPITSSFVGRREATSESFVHFPCSRRRGTFKTTPLLSGNNPWKFTQRLREAF